jgi:hypothetical protein
MTRQSAPQMSLDYTKQPENDDNENDRSATYTSTAHENLLKLTSAKQRVHFRRAHGRTIRASTHVLSSGHRACSRSGQQDDENDNQN